GPVLVKHKLSSVKLIAWDHNRDLLFQRASVILNDPKAARYVWGIGYHWYETWTGSGMRFENVQQVKEAFPAKHLLLTEACNEGFDPSRLNDWSLGERYGYSMIHDLNSGAEGWTDWNILLDQNGGPNHAGNYCFAPVIADTRSGGLIYTNSYYYIGHFSKFIRPGAKRIGCSSNRDALQATAFKNKNGKIVVVVLNTTDRFLSYYLWMKGKAAPLNSLPHSIMTIVL
ncbi:MAG TPA: glycoside hydrolase family 30 protein, partial [Bacteroidia bacterium]|nr:glycoside hydrolase family 30 protein [Bacteroidia bacterium]